MNKNESKYFNTAVKMDIALINLLEKKEFEYITIKEICDLAGVNRSTFYLHYENTFDLLQETTKYIFDKHLSYYSYDTKGISEQFVSCDLGELVFITNEYIVPYLTFVKENQRVFKVGFNYVNREKIHDRMFENIYSPILARFDVPENERPYIMKYYLSGVFAIVSEWLNNGCSDDIGMIAKIIIDCILGERRYKTNNA